MASANSNAVDDRSVAVLFTNGLCDLLLARAVRRHRDLLACGPMPPIVIGHTSVAHRAASRTSITLTIGVSASGKADGPLEVATHVTGPLKMQTS
jgi:hypothetical protein